MVPYTASSVLCWKFSERLAEEATKGPNGHVVSKQDQVPKREEKAEGILSGVSQKEAAWGVWGPSVPDREQWWWLKTGDT